MVRLEVTGGIPPVVVVVEFQFLYGAIGSPRTISGTWDITWFQFLYGAIGRPVGLECPLR